LMVIDVHVKALSKLVLLICSLIVSDR
jgi:hypothetical protein